MKINILIIFLLLSFAAFAQPHEEISLQGLLTDENGYTVDDGNYEITFNLYEQETGGTSIWSETQTVAVVNGVFSVQLGSVTDLDPDFDEQYWVGISVQGGAELSSRIKLGASPYAMYALTVPQNSINSYHIQTGGVSGNNINQMGASNGQLLKWNGSQWAPGDDNWSGLTFPYFSMFDSFNTGFALENESTGSAFAGNNSYGNIGKISGNYGLYGYNGNTMNYGFVGGEDHAVFGKYESQSNWGAIGNSRNGIIGHKTSTNNGAGVFGVYTNDNEITIENPHRAAGVIGLDYPSNNIGYLGDASYGAYGKHYSNGNFGYLGGSAFPVYGESGFNSNYGFLGGFSYAVYGKDADSENYGYLANEFYGVYGKNVDQSTYGYLGGSYGVYGEDENSGNFAFIGSNSHGLFALNMNTGPAVLGVVTDNESLIYSTSEEAGIYGYHYSNRNKGYLGSYNYGVYGSHNTGNYGHIGSLSYGVYGSNTSNSNYGYIGSSSHGVYGYNGSSENHGSLGNFNNGAFGYSDYYDREGYLGGRFGAYGYDNATGNFGYLAYSNAGVYGSNKSSGPGVFGLTSDDFTGLYVTYSNVGVYGRDYDSRNYGYLGSDQYGVYGKNNDGNYGYIGGVDVSIYARTNDINDEAIKGENFYNDTYGYLGGYRGVQGVYIDGPWGYIGSQNIAVYGYAQGSSETAIYGSNSTGWAGYFYGDLYVSNNVGIGTNDPDYDLHVVGYAGKTTGSYWLNLSDGRLKNVKKKYTRGIDEIKELNPIIYSFKENNPFELPSDDEFIGIVVQELQDIFPEAVSHYSEDYLAFDAEPVFWALVNAVKQQQDEIDKYKKISGEQQQQIDELNEKYEQLLKRLEE